jgi:HSP20 family protein
MSSIIRWDPFREMLNLRREMDRLFDNTFFGPDFNWAQPAAWDLALDVAENDDEIIVKASIPGINPDDLEVTYTENTLTIKGEVKAEEEKEGSKYHLRERRYGTFMRSISLPVGVKADSIQANYEAGVLTLHLPKSEEVKPKRIAVKTGTPQMIEAKVKDIAHKN